MLPTELLLDPFFRSMAAAGFVLVYMAVCAGIVLRERRRHRAKSALATASTDSPVWLITYASQIGEAEAIAVETGRRLHQAGLSARVLALNEVKTEELCEAERALFVVSTYGEGDAPDNGALFASQLMMQSMDLSRLHFAVLALGDSSYAHYCGFGRALDAWLNGCQAQPLHARIDMDCGEAEALSTWQQLLQHLAGSSDAPDWMAPAFEEWRLVGRELLNPGSEGAPLYGLDLIPTAGVFPFWESGDLVQVCIATDMERPREYSIASLPVEGCVRLLMRLHRDAEGKTGLVSGWLSQCEINSPIMLRVRPHRLFRLDENAARPLILIGNGSGLAGLRGHLKSRALAGLHENWLIYGERNAASDSIWADELDAWLDEGVLRRLDRVFSRDGKPRRYVQDALTHASDGLREWVAAGAAIYVCGSLKGMASGVELALTELLGEGELADLKISGRYRRDVY